MKQKLFKRDNINQEKTYRGQVERKAQVDSLPSKKDITNNKIMTDWHGEPAPRICCVLLIA
jgi:hypothetical protein